MLNPLASGLLPMISFKFRFYERLREEFSHGHTISTADHLFKTSLRKDLILIHEGSFATSIVSSKQHMKRTMFQK
jgi:hypothetical protein